MAEKHIISSGSSGTDSTSTIYDIEKAPRFTLEPLASLPFLPEDCLLTIMQYLGPVDLHNLSRVCDRIKIVASHKSLWRKVDFRPYSLTASQLMQYLKYFTSSTTYIAIQGFIGASSRSTWKRRVITPYFLESITWKCPFLQTLILERITFERIWTSLPANTVKRFSLANFPATLSHLSLKGSIVTGIDAGASYFQGMHDIFPNLKVLILSYCRWVCAHDFMAISKCPRLEELRMKGCVQLSDTVAYTSLAARFGFPSLKILDLSITRMGDSDVIAFRHVHTLTHLYLESPPANEEDVESKCGEQLYDGDLTESTDDDDMQLSPATSQNVSASQLSISSSVSHASSSQMSSPRLSENCKTDNLSPVLRSDSEKGVGNRDPGTPCSLASCETIRRNITLNSVGPLTVRIGQKHTRSRKRPSDDSEFSDENNSIVQSSIINTDISDSELIGTSSGSTSPDKKVRYLDQFKKTGHISRKLKRKCSNKDSVLNNYNVVPVPTAADLYKNVVAGPSSVQQLQDFPPPSPVVIISTGPSGSEGNSENDNDLQISLDSNLPFFMPPDFDPEQNNIFNPNFYYLADNEDPFNDSTITDMCVMSFVLDSNEADRIGYIRLMAVPNEEVRSQLHTLVLRNYRLITDATLQYLTNLDSLRYLDVSGTSVTEGGVLQFRLNRPDVQVVCDFNDLPI